jgi:colicin import membrane protein
MSPDANGFWTPEERRAEAVAAEAALKARRDPYQIAGELTADETKATAEADARLAAAAAANQAARRAVTAARDAVPSWRPATGRETATAEEAERALGRAMRDEEDARGASVRLSIAIQAARAARREAADR